MAVMACQEMKGTSRETPWENRRSVQVPWQRGDRQQTGRGLPRAVSVTLPSRTLSSQVIAPTERLRDTIHIPVDLYTGCNLFFQHCIYPRVILTFAMYYFNSVLYRTPNNLATV